MQKIEAVLRQVMRHGMIFHPWLVTSGGEVVGQVPDLFDQYLMKAHLYFKENHDGKVRAPETIPPAA
jgi:hypothetical protein